MFNRLGREGSKALYHGIGTTEHRNQSMWSKWMGHTGPNEAKRNWTKRERERMRSFCVMFFVSVIAATVCPQVFLKVASGDHASKQDQKEADAWLQDLQHGITWPKIMEDLVQDRHGATTFTSSTTESSITIISP